MRANMVVTVTSQDRPGVVEKAARVVHEHGGNLEETRGVRLGGVFTSVMVVSVEEDRYRPLAEGIHALDGDAFHFHVQRLDEHASDPAMADGQFRLNVSGADHEGILHRIASYLAGVGANIDEIATTVENAPLSGVPLFSLHAHVTFPVDLDRKELLADLEAIAEQKCVDVEMRKRVGTGPLKFDEETNVIPVAWMTRGTETCAGAAAERTAAGRDR